MFGLFSLATRPSTKPQASSVEAVPPLPVSLTSPDEDKAALRRAGALPAAARARIRSMPEQRGWQPSSPV